MTKPAFSDKIERNEYNLITFDPGAAATGWVWFRVDFHAFSRPENKVLHNLKWWDYGQFSGPEVEHYKGIRQLITESLRFASHLSIDVVAEDFELTQLIGGRNLLSPVRINAITEWECYNRSIKFNVQSRQLRTSVNRQRLKVWGFDEKWRKDEYAAMQHAITWLRRTKQKANQRPWKLSHGGVLNSKWDCSCERNRKNKCDLVHP